LSEQQAKTPAHRDIPVTVLQAPVGFQPPAPSIESELKDEVLFGGDEAIVHSPLHRRRRRGRWLMLGILCGFLVGAGIAGYWFRDSLKKFGSELAELAEDKSSEQTTGAAEKEVPATAKVPTTVFPRRVLAICVNNYVYANPVGYGEPGLDLRALLERLTRVLHVPANQVTELSDASSRPARPPAQKRKARTPSAPRASRPAMASRGTPPLKPIIEKTITRFLDSARAQDCILLFFLGHVAVIDDKGYLAPLEGDLAAKNTLIPLEWLYKRLADCKARQKVLVLDCCRLDPGRGFERPGSGVMPGKLDVLLLNPPPGVQVWSACTSGQYSYELEGAGVFLENLYRSLGQGAIRNPEQPDDLLPMDILAESVNRSTAQEAQSSYQAIQTPRLSGRPPAEGAHYDADEPLPDKIELPQPSLPASGTARVEEIRQILQEIELPPIKLAREQMMPLRIESLIPFSAKVMAPYLDPAGEAGAENATEPAIRVEVKKVVRLLRQEFNPEHAAISFRDTFSAGGNSERFKELILREQANPAKVLLKLTEALEEYRKAGEARDKETSRRWQAHYDYVQGQLLARIAYVQEYDLMLGKIRKDELPQLLPKVHTGYRLASQEKMQSGKEVKEIASEAKKTFQKLAREHPGTPWEVLGRRASLAALGLKWEPTR
jgi:hypothetical protein